MYEKDLLLNIDDSIRDKAMKNRLSIICETQKMNLSYYGEEESLIKERASKQISKAIVEKMTFEKELSFSNIQRYYSSIFIFTQEELLSLIQFAMKLVDKNGKVYLTRCNKCGMENYAIAVCDGVCVWCSYNANEDEEYKKSLKEHKDAG